MLRFNPLAPWLQVPIGSKLARTVKSIQNVDVSQSVAGGASGATVDTTITSVDTTRSIILVRSQDFKTAGSNLNATHWSLTSATNLRIHGVSNSGGGPSTLTFYVTIVEFY